MFADNKCAIILSTVACRIRFHRGAEMQEQEAKADEENNNELVAGRVAEHVAAQVFKTDQPQSDIAILREYGIESADIEANCEQLARQVYLFRRYIGKLPCMRIREGLVPIGIPFWGASYRRRFSFFQWFDAWLAGSDGPIELVDIDDAEPGFRDELKQFVRVRLDHFWRTDEALPSWVSGGMGLQTARLQVLVSSVTSGARVLASPAYFQNFIVFGGPTSPATGYLSPGRYIFKISTPKGQPTIDPGVFDIPPSFNLGLVI